MLPTDEAATAQRRPYPPGLAYPPPPGSGFTPEGRPPAMFTPDPAKHLAHIAWARDVRGWQRWELAARFIRPGAKETR